MIKNRMDLEEYLLWDKIALGKEELKRPRIFRDEIWRFEILLRYCEYYNNKKKNIFQKLLFLLIKYKFHNYSIKLGFSIPLNVADKGLSIAHYGSIVINSNAKIGKNCRIQENVTIGATGGNNDSPILGDNVFIASGARLIGNIIIGNEVSIGANAVVTRSFPQNHITLAGVPARIISSKGSEGFIKYKAKELYYDRNSNN